VVDRADYIVAAPHCDAICLLESASSLQEVVHLTLAADGSLRLDTAATDPKLVAEDRRCRGAAATNTPGLLLLASVPAPDREAAAFLSVPASDSSSPDLKMVQPRWLTPKMVQPVSRVQERGGSFAKDSSVTVAATAADANAGADGTVTTHASDVEADASSLPPLFPSAAASGRRLRTGAIEMLAESRNVKTPLATVVSADAMQGLQQQLRAMEAGLRRQIKAVEDGMHQRLDRLEMILGLLLQERRAASTDIADSGGGAGLAQ